MNLHHNREAFEELITATSMELQIPVAIIEKDYYVTLALRELSNRIKGMVFKGGTSLTKCYHVIDRFSEDLDISYAASNGVPGESRKRQLKKAIISSMAALNLPISNLEQTRSRRNYNNYRATYPSLYSSLPEIPTELVIETYIALLPFPTEIRSADNYIHQFLQESNQEYLAERFNLMPFLITTQSIERTLIDKIFALCDYYLMGKVARHSRHLYDIHKILEKKIIPDPLLIQEVRKLRAALPVCPSAADEVYIPNILEDIIKRNVYRDDYKNITEQLLFTSISYETTISSLQLIIDGNYFD